MDKFFANLTGKEKESAANKWQGGQSDMRSIRPSPKKNVFANMALPKQRQRTAKPPPGGQSLGGSQPGTLHPIVLSQPGPLGLEIEKRRDVVQSAIVARVLPQSQAEMAGVQRGDILCRYQSSTEYSYVDFLALAKANTRPLQFNVRRMESSILVDPATTGSVDAWHRKQAMIAAAEAREAKHKSLIPKTKERVRVPSRGMTEVNHTYTESNSIETRQAVEAIQAVEKTDVETLGYNPYESTAMTSSQARTAQVVMTSGNIHVKKIGRDDDTKASATITSQEFDDAFSTLVTTSSDASVAQKSLSTMRKLIVNATTKGQRHEEEESFKFRRVRLSNPKINEVITNVQGALELMMSVGFELSENEDDGETYLVYPLDAAKCVWLQEALERMERYERGS